MSLSPGNKSGDSFNFCLQKSIARWEPSLSDHLGRNLAILPNLIRSLHVYSLFYLLYASINFHENNNAFQNIILSNELQERNLHALK